MKSKVKLFEENTALGGFTLSVRDDWVYKIKKVHITTAEKDLYLEEFGEKIVTHNEFYDWWIRINKIGKYKEDPEE